MTPHHFLRKPTHPYSLIVDLEGETEPLGVTMGLDLGTVINRLQKEYICVGSGEILADKKTYNLEEIRAYIVRDDDLDTVRKILKKWSKQKSSLKEGSEVTLQGIIGTLKERSPVIYNDDSDTIISLLINKLKLKVRFIEKNLRFIKGIDLNQEDLRENEVYVHGLAILIGKNEWEIQGRALITIKG